VKIAGVLSNLVESLLTILLLRTICMHSCCNWSASCVAAQPTKNQKTTVAKIELLRPWGCNFKKNGFLFRMVVSHTCCVFLMWALFYSSSVCISAYAPTVWLQIQGPLRERLSIRSGFCGLPYYCAPLVCVPTGIGVLAVWRHNKPKTKNVIPSAVGL